MRDALDRRRDPLFAAPALGVETVCKDVCCAGAADAALWGSERSDAEPSAPPVYEAVKRALDVVVSLTALTLLLPLWVLIALVVKLTDGGPVLYPHTRVGLNGRTFRCYKFRSMCVNADAMMPALEHSNVHGDSRTFKIPNDPRVTRVGRWLRRTSIDEFPQLINVLAGDMSLVGPRPPVPNEVAKYTPADWRRLGVKPGLTCIWQVSGRSRVPFPEQLTMDIQYIERRSLWLDAKLLALTVPAVLGGDGAY